MTAATVRYLAGRAASLNLLLTDQQLGQFAAYQALLQEWNERFNLTAAKTPQEIQERHFADSLTCSVVTGNLDGQSLIDVGSGAGFPGLPLKILFPGLRLTLLESVGKKARFLEAVSGELGLEQVEVVAERAEVAAHDALYREQFDWAVARAVAPLAPLLEYLLPFCRLGGHALAQKGERAPDELVAARSALALLGGTLQEMRRVRTPNAKRAYLILVEKSAPTPDEYPRRPGMPTKRPL